MRGREFGAVVDFGRPVDTVFGYLADPRNRPEWQSSLIAVTLKERAAPYVGMRWRETTVVGVRPRLEITRLEPGATWSERGTWHGVEADLTLRFSPTDEGCRVRAEGLVRGAGPWAPPATLAGRLASAAIRSDLRRASRVLEQRAHG